ncbi:MAG: zinc ribbon domain-containing protein [Acidimicrobiia bacterium]
MTDPLHRLLEIQDLDVAADQLRHRRDTLPERARLTAARSAAHDHESGLVELRASLDRTVAEQRAAERELEALAGRAEAEERRLYGGGVTAVREVEAVQAELASIVRRQGALEDDVLTHMDEVDELTRHIAGEEGELAARQQEAAGLIGAIEAAEAAIDAELATTAAAREALAATVAADVLADYERRRSRLGGVAVARLEGGRCLGCHLSLPATEVDAIRRAPEGALVTHEECGRILVR